MSRPYRHVHPGGSHFEITTRALQSRFLIPTGALPDVNYNCA